MEITVKLPENVYRNFTEIAEKRHQRIEDVIADKLGSEVSFDDSDYEKRVSEWSDEAVLALAKFKLPKEQTKRMSVLLDRLQEGELTDAEERELEIYTELHQISTIRKAYGIAEAVKRKLINSPADLK